MSLSTIISATEIRQAHKAMLTTLRRGCQQYRRWIGWQGGSGEYTVEWNPTQQFWMRSDDAPYYGRWLIWFGKEDPADVRMLNIICEVNPPEEGIHRQCAGLFVKDASDVVYFTHSGKIGGGRKGIGKSSFLAQYRGTLETVSWPDGKESEAIVIGRIDGERFPAQVANFIREVQRFKATASASGQSGAGEEQPAPLPPEPQFNQEFSGQRRGYRPPSEIETRCDHGLIINALANSLRTIDLEVANDQNRDLYVPGRSGRMEILFEAKAELATSSIYQAIGQLLYHSANQIPPPSLVMVLPATPNATTQKVLDRLQIKVLVFGWQGHQPVFRNLNDVIE